MASASVADYAWELTLGRIQQRIPDAKAILARATVLRIGWEMDNEVCAVEMKDGTHILVGTSHGGVYEISPEDLKEDMANYEAALAQSKEVLAALLLPLEFVEEAGEARLDVIEECARMAEFTNDGAHIAKVIREG